MRLFSTKLFDDFIEGNGATYTSESLNEFLGTADVVCLQAVVDQVSGSSPTLTVQLEASCDGRNFVSPSLVPEINLAVLSTSATTSAVGANSGAAAGARFVRTRINLGGSSPAAHVALWATGRVGKRPFAPSAIQGLFAWFTADSGITLSTGASVSAWSDVSSLGLAGAAVQGNGPQQPTLTNVAALCGRPALLFTGSNATTLVSAAFASPLAQPGTVFIVCQSTTSVGNQNLIDGLVGGTHRWGIAALAPQPAAYAGVLLSAGVDILSPSIFTTVFNGGSSAIRISGDAVSVTGNAGTQTLDGLTIGGGYNQTSMFTGYIAEIIIFSRALTTFEIRLVEEYLSSKYGIKLA